MKNKRFVVFLVLIMLMVFTAVAYPNESRGEALIKEKEIELMEVNVYTETKDVFSKDVFDKVFSKKDKSFLENDLNADINYLKDSVQVIIKTRINPSTQNNLILYADNNPVEVSSKGTILIPKDTKVVSKSELLNDENISNITIGLDGFDISIIEMTKANGSEIVFRASSGELLAVMDEKEDKFLNTNNMVSYRKGYGDKYYPGDWVHCNRFNGSSTDDVHYDWRNGSADEKAKAVKNFYGSDCHIALTQAGSKCTSIGSCNCNTSERAAYCSGFTKEKWIDKNCDYTYHKHSYLVIPR